MRLNPLVMMREEKDGTGIVFDPENNRALKLNRTGVVIWHALEAGMDAGQTAGALMEAFDVNEETASADVAHFMQKLLDNSLSE